MSFHYAYFYFFVVGEGGCGLDAELGAGDGTIPLVSILLIIGGGVGIYPFLPLPTSVFLAIHFSIFITL